MKKIFYLGILLGLLSACQENKMDGFDSNGAVYFQTNPSDWNNLADSVLYSFAGKRVKHTIRQIVPVRRISLKINRSIAVETIHFILLASRQQTKEYT